MRFLRCTDILKKSYFQTSNCFHLKHQYDILMNLYGVLWLYGNFTFPTPTNIMEHTSADIQIQFIYLQKRTFDKHGETSQKPSGLKFTELPWINIQRSGKRREVTLNVHINCLYQVLSVLPTESFGSKYFPKILICTYRYKSSEKCHQEPFGPKVPSGRLYYCEQLINLFTAQLKFKYIATW